MNFLLINNYGGYIILFTQFIYLLLEVMEESSKVENNKKNAFLFSKISNVLLIVVGSIILTLNLLDYYVLKLFNHLHIHGIIEGIVFIIFGIILSYYSFKLKDS